MGCALKGVYARLRGLCETHQGAAPRGQETMGIAEFIIGPAEGRTRWLNPSYDFFAIGTGTPGTFTLTMPSCVRPVK